MTPVKKTLVGLFSAACFGIALYGIVFFLAIRGDAFQFVQERILASREVGMRLGTISNTRLTPFGSYDEKTIDSDEWVAMSVDVVGEKRSAEIDVTARKERGVWRIERAMIEGQALNLN